MKMKVLLIGNRKHPLLYNLIDEIKKSDSNISFDILSQDSDIIDKENSRYFNEIYNLKIPSYLLKNRLLRGLVKQIAFRTKLKYLFKNNYDYIHIHYVEDVIIRDIHFICNNLKSKLIVSVWGSDFLRATKRKREKMRKLFSFASTITISNEIVIEYFKDYYNSEIFCDKIKMVKFFVKPLDELMCNYRLSKHSESKQKLGIDKNKIVLTVGYNASYMQQHTKILDALLGDDRFVESYKDRIHLIFPLTYPKNEQYVNSIKAILDVSSFSYSLFTNFLNNQDLIELRYSSDIFVQLQTTDMMSGSMLEYLFLGNLVITGKWLPYNELLSEGMNFETITEISDLSAFLLNLDLENLYRLRENQAVIKRVFGKDILISKWIDIYDKNIS